MKKQVIYRASLIAFAVIALSGCSKETDSGISKTDQSITHPALIETVTSGNSSVDYAFPDTVRAEQRVDISFEASGKLISFPVQEGQQVKKGAVLAELDKTALLNNLKSIQAEYEKAQTDAARFERLYAESKSISISDLEKVRTQRNILEAKMGNARQELINATLKAPFNGTIAQTFVTNFNMVQARETVLALHNLETLELVINIPASFIMNSPQEIESVAVFDQLPEQRFPVSFKQIVTAADSVSESYKVTLFLDTSISKTVILPGMKATVIPAAVISLATESSTDNLLAPLRAVVSDNAGGNFVWLVSADGSVAKQTVIPGEVQGNKVEISGNLKSGDRIVVAGLNSLREGMKVTPLEQE